MKTCGSGRTGRGGGGRKMESSSLSKIFRGRFGKAVNKNTGPEARRKWLHHCLRTLQKALKNARIFEQRKLKRRLVVPQQQQQQRDGQLAGREQAVAADNEARLAVPHNGPPPNGCPVASDGSLASEGDKIRCQLELSKTLDLGELAVRMALRCGFPEDLVRAAAQRSTSPPLGHRTTNKHNPQQQTQKHQPQQKQHGKEEQQQLKGISNGGAQDAADLSTGGDGGSGSVGGLVAAVLASRLLRASCVRKVLEEIQRDFQTKFGAASLRPDKEVSESGSEREPQPGTSEEPNETDKEGGGGSQDQGKEGSVEVGDDDGVQRPRKRQRTLTAAPREAPARKSVAVARVSAATKNAEDVCSGRGSEADDDEEGEDSGVIEEADINDFLAETVGPAPGAGDNDGGSGLGDSSVEDSDGDDADSQNDGDGDGGSTSEASDNGSFDSQDFDAPSGRRPRKGRVGGPGAGLDGHLRSGSDVSKSETTPPLKRRQEAGSATAAGALPKGTRSKKVVLAPPSDDAAKKIAPGKVVSGADASEGSREVKRAAGKRDPATGGNSKAQAGGAATAAAQGRQSKRAMKAHVALLNRNGKNRLGQHARRKLFEKMYGKEARHLQEYKVKDTRRDDKARQPASGSRGGDRGGGGGGGGGVGKTANIAVTAAAPSVKQLHPSWAAKQRQKQLLQHQVAAAAPKKIRFDEEGEQVEGGGDRRGGGCGSIGEAARKIPVLTERRRGGGPLLARGSARESRNGSGRVEKGTAADRTEGGSGARWGRGPQPGGGGAAGRVAGAESLHPSWEARQKQKQQQLAAAPAGKKIVFED